MGSSRLDLLMTLTSEDLVRRRPVWGAMSDLFLDTEIDESFNRFIARSIIESGYTREELHHILWEEVFPVIEWNLRNPAGVWAGFDLGWLQERILGSAPRQTAEEQPTVAQMIREAWGDVCRYLPEHLR
jgi:hypothetical protein